MDSELDIVKEACGESISARCRASCSAEGGSALVTSASAEGSSGPPQQGIHPHRASERAASLDGTEKTAPYTNDVLGNPHHNLPGGMGMVGNGSSITDLWEWIQSEGLDDLADLDQCIATPELVQVPRAALESIDQAEVDIRLRDKMLWFVHDLSTKHRDGFSEEGAPVNIRFYRKRYSVDDSSLISELKKLKVIEKCQGHITGVRSASYRFTEGIRANRKTVGAKLATKLLIRNRGSRERYAKAQLSGAQLPCKFWTDLCEIKPGPKFVSAFDAYLEQMSQDQKHLRSVECQLQRWLAGERRMTVRNNRITNSVCLLPSELRSELLVNGEAAVELDLKNSHPALLAAIFSPTPRSSGLEIEQHKKLVELVKSGIFYESFEHCWLRDRRVFVEYFVPKGDRSERDIEIARRRFLELPPRTGIKLCWQLIINCAPTFYQTEIMRELSSSFLYFTKRLKAFKSSGEDALGKQLRRREAMMVNELAQYTDQPCATIYDGWLSNEQGVRDILKAAPEVTEKHLGFVHLPVRK